MIKVSIDLLQRNKSLIWNEQFYKKLLEKLEEDPNKKYIDPIMMTVMVDPVVLSSGMVIDRKTILNEDGTLKYNQCPLSRENLEPKVYPLN